MAFVLIGRIIALNRIETIASKTDASKTFQRRQVYLDCSRYDSITGEQLQENRPLLEFGGKGLDQLNELERQGLKKGDLVSIEFAVQGNTYKDAQGNTKNYTGIRPYSIERYVPRSQQAQQQQQAQQPAPVAQPAPQPQAAAPAPQPQAQQANDAFTQRPENDGLPF